MAEEDDNFSARKCCAAIAAADETEIRFVADNSKAADMAERGRDGFIRRIVDDYDLVLARFRMPDNAADTCARE